jgi:hypothetical protein
MVLSTFTVLKKSDRRKYVRCLRLSVTKVWSIEKSTKTKRWEKGGRREDRRSKIKEDGVHGVEWTIKLIYRI